LDDRGIKYKLITAKGYNSNASYFMRMSIILGFFIRGNVSTILNNGPIICYESLSSIGLFVSNFLKRKQKVFFHYHEYFSTEEYQNQSYLERLGHRLEKYIQRNACWISHTNNDRLEMWASENPKIKSQILRVLPNYPPEKWIQYNSKISRNDRQLKIVHIGSLSLETMYLKEVLAKFGSNEKFTLDFYSHSFTKEVVNAIKVHSNCRINGAIEYQDIFRLKGLYDVGLVIYKGLSLNVKYSAPNKIFEYLALDLDVWCSDKLISAVGYQRNDCYPKMLMVDYTNLDHFDVEQAKSIAGLSNSRSTYTSESVFKEILENLSN
jgi:hypothetical protein